jgi:hypothetical protein
MLLILAIVFSLSKGLLAQLSAINVADNPFSGAEDILLLSKQANAGIVSY